MGLVDKPPETDPSDLVRTCPYHTSCICIFTIYLSTQSYPPCSTSYYTPGHEISQIGSQNNLSIMQLGRYSVSTLVPPPIHSITFSPDGRFFAVAAEKGYEIWKTWPLGLVRRRGQLNNRLLRDVMSPVARLCEYSCAEPIANLSVVLPGSLALAVILPHAPLLVLQAGGTAPLYAPNKVVIYNDKLREAVAEIEFGCVANECPSRRFADCFIF